MSMMGGKCKEKCILMNKVSTAGRKKVYSTTFRRTYDSRDIFDSKNYSNNEGLMDIRFSVQCELEIKIKKFEIEMPKKMCCEIGLEL